MSDNDKEDAPLTNWFDSESDFPKISSVNTTLRLGVNVSPHFVKTHHDWALENEDSSAMDSAPNKGNSAGSLTYCWKRLDQIQHYTRGDLLDTPTHTPPQNKSTSPFLCHRTWGMGRGRRVRREGEKTSIAMQTQTCMRNQVFKYLQKMTLSHLTLPRKLHYLAHNLERRFSL